LDFVYPSKEAWERRINAAKLNDVFDCHTQKGSRRRNISIMINIEVPISY
jgi:hypothetical protein